MDDKSDQENQKAQKAGQTDNCVHNFCSTFLVPQLRGFIFYPQTAFACSLRPPVVFPPAEMGAIVGPLYADTVVSLIAFLHSPQPHKLCLYPSTGKNIGLQLISRLYLRDRKNRLFYPRLNKI